MNEEFIICMKLMMLLQTELFLIPRYNNETIMKDPSLMYDYAREIVSFPGGHNEGFPDTSKQMFGKVYKYIANKGYIKAEVPDFPTFEAGYRELVLCENIFTSSKEDKWIIIKD